MLTLLMNLFYYNGIIDSGPSNIGLIPYLKYSQSGASLRVIVRSDHAALSVAQ